MRAIVYRESGPSSVMSEEALDRTEPGPDEVLVRLVRAGVNPTDWKFRMRPIAFPTVVPGHDGAGVIEAVGADVHDFSVGQRVWLTLAQHQRPFGTAAEFTTVPVDRVFPLPDDCSFDLGASIGVPAITAHRALTSTQTSPKLLHPGALTDTTVLIAGGAGAVGNAAIQLATWAGATVITTVSSEEKAELARAAGAHHVLNYRTDDVVATIRAIVPTGVDLVVEVAPAPNNAIDVDVTKDNATIAIYANEGGDEMSLAVRANMSKNLNYQFLILYTMPTELIADAGASVTAALRDGALRVGEDAGLRLHYYELEDTASAHDDVEGGLVGKALLRTGSADD